LYHRTVVVQNKSSLLLPIILTNTQILQQLTIDIKTEIIYRIFKKCRSVQLGLRDLESYNERGGE
jgi:hypothetical protein